MFLVSQFLFQDIRGIHYYDVSSDKKSQEIFFLSFFLNFFIFGQIYLMDFFFKI